MMQAWWNPLCWVGYCEEAAGKVGTGCKCPEQANPGFVMQTCSILTLLIVFRILAKLEYMFPGGLPRGPPVADDGVGTGTTNTPPNEENEGPPPPPPPTPSGGAPFLPPGAANLLLELAARHFLPEQQIDRGEVDTVLRALDMLQRTQFNFQAPPPQLPVVQNRRRRATSIPTASRIETSV